ncbi:MAG: secondary thiamine-phosphate synthase enzyme YjbQ [Dehalococcoidia bacterium]
MQRFTVQTAKREQMVEITDGVRKAVDESGVRDGIVFVYVPHTTAGVTINENADPDVQTDMLAHLGKLVPRDAGFRHAEGNSDGHLKASLLGSTAWVPLSAGALALGRWQGIFFCEFDGPRQREVRVQVIAGGGT